MSSAGFVFFTCGVMFLMIALTTASFVFFPIGAIFFVTGMALKNRDDETTEPE